MDLWILLLPEQTGIFTSYNELTSVINSGKVDYILKVDNEKIARQQIRDHYSIERLFLMGIDDTGVIYKNKFYSIPQGYTFVESLPKKDMQEEI